MGITPPYKDGKLLSAFDATRPAKDVCISEKKHSINTDIYCGECPPEKKSQCKKTVGEKCIKHEDCHNYGILVPMDKRTGCCRAKCVMMKNENGLLCKPSKIGEACKTTFDCDDYNGKTKIVCCNDSKTGPPTGGYFGKCIKAGINSGVSYCPKTPGILMEKQVGESCNVNTDCIGWGWGIGGKGTLCCNKKCLKNPHKLNICPYIRGTWLAAHDVPNAYKLCASGKTYKSGWDIKCA